MSYKKGDTVSWQTSQGKTEGKLVAMKTNDFEFKGQNFKPTEDDPYWIVESNSSGSQAAHKQSTLEKA